MTHLSVDVDFELTVAVKDERTLKSDPPMSRHMVAVHVADALDRVGKRHAELDVIATMLRQMGEDVPEHRSNGQ